MCSAHPSTVPTGLTSRSLASPSWQHFSNPRMCQNYQEVKNAILGNPLMVWLGFCASTAEGRVQCLLGLIPGQGTKVNHALAKKTHTHTHTHTQKQVALSDSH